MNAVKILTSMAALSNLENSLVSMPNNNNSNNNNEPPSTLFHPVTSFDDPSLTWLNPPDGWKVSDDDKKSDREGRDGWSKIDDETGELLFAPPAKKDYWRKTYYQPLLVKDDGSALTTIVPNAELPVTVETSFELTPKAQFDQAGIIIRIDPEHWIKTGIEVVDGQPRLSCVVTNGFSDWSTQNWPDPGVKLRVHMLPQHGGSFVVEAAPLGSDEYSFVRIAHLNKDMNHALLNDDPKVKDAFEGASAPPDSFMVGVFAACPVDQQGMVATFHNISITKGSSFVHDA